MMKNILIIGAVIIAIAAGAWMLTPNDYLPSDQSSDYSQAGTPQPSDPAEAQVPPANQPAGKPEDKPAEAVVNTTKGFTITSQNYSFAPSLLAVKKGDTVKITLKNTGGTHDLRIDEFNAATKIIKSGEEDTITFIADKTGSFEFYCSVGSHRQMGMKGMLTVTE